MLYKFDNSIKFFVHFNESPKSLNDLLHFNQTQPRKTFFFVVGHVKKTFNFQVVECLISNYLFFSEIVKC